MTMKKILFLLALMFSNFAYSWEPTRNIEVIVGFAPGSGNELSFRGVSSIIEKQNKNINFIIINRPGADGVIGMNEFITKPADGYHLYVPSEQGIWVTAEYFNKDAVRYTLNDFEYVISLARSPLALIVPADAPITTIPTLLNILKNPTKNINVAAGSGAHKLAFEYMSEYLKLDRNKIQTISYKGPAQASVAVAAKEVDFGIVPVAVAHTLSQSGKVRILGIFSDKRIEKIKDVPLVSDWVPGANVFAGWGIILPKNTPKEIVEWYSKTFAAAIKTPEAQRFFENNLMIVNERAQTPEGYKAAMLELRKQWIPIISKMKLE